MNTKSAIAFLLGLTFTSSVFAYDQKPVDYWGDNKDEVLKNNDKKEEKITQDKAEKDDLQKVMVVENKYESMDDKTLMSLPPDQLLQMSIDAYNQKIKKNLTPIEYAYFKDPNSL